MKLQLKLKTKLQLYFFLVGIFSVTLTSIIVYNDAKRTLEKISFERLTSIREVKKEFIENYFSHLKNLALTLSRNNEIIEGVNNTDGKTILNNKQGQSDFGLTDIARNFKLNDVFLINSTAGNIVFSLNSKDVRNKPITNKDFLFPYLRNAYVKSINGKDIAITDFHKGVTNGDRPSAYISAPIYKTGKISGAVIIEFSVTQINQIMTNDKNWNNIGFGETAETYIVGPDYKMRTDSRFFIENPDKYFSMLKNNGASNEIISAIKSKSTSILLQEVNTIASKDGAKGLSDTKIILDYRGVEVISAYSPLNIADLNWTIISEIDTGEAFGTINSLREYLILAGLLIILLASTLGVAFSRSISKPITTLINTAKQFGKGNLNQRVVNNFTDEFGLLFSTFNTMAEKIMKKTDELTLEIEDRKKIYDQLLLSREQLQSLSSHLQTVREEERKLIAREIHDELGQALNTLKLKFSFLKQLSEKNGQIDQTTLGDIYSLLDNTINSVKRIITELRPQLLDDLGLTAAIEWQVKEFNKNNGVICSLNIVPEEIDTSSEKAIALYRILQEALTNIARHSDATCVDISLIGNDDKIEMTIKDNGKGISGEDLNNSKSFGLMGIRERARYFGGTVTIQSYPSKGTTIIATLPNLQAKND